MRPEVHRDPPVLTLSLSLTLTLTLTLTPLTLTLTLTLSSQSFLSWWLRTCARCSGARGLSSHFFFSVTPSHVAGPDYVVDQVSGASVNLSPCALLLVMAVRLRVVRADTSCGQPVRIPFAPIAHRQVAMSEGEPFHRGLRNLCLLHHMPYSGTGSGSGPSEPAGAT